MKILIISDAWHPQVNGVVRTYEHLCEELKTMGHDTKVVGPSDFPKRLSLPGYSEIKLALMPYRHLKKMIDEYEPDHIHLATEGPLGWAGRKYCIKHNHDFTTSYHTHFPDYAAQRFAKYLPFLFKPTHSLAKAVVKKFHSDAQTMFIATKSLEDDLKAWGFTSPARRLSRGVNLDLFFPGENTAFRNMKGPIALYVGRIAIEKSIEDFLEMEWTGSKVIVGDGPSREELTNKYPEVHFAGIKTGEDLAAHYRSADIFVFPSRTDTFGMVLVEALASGLSIAAYNVTGPKDIITMPTLGSLSENDLAEAAVQALNAPGSKEDRLIHVKENYSWKNAGKQFVAGLLS